LDNMNNKSEEIIKKSIEQAIINAVSKKIYPPQQPGFLGRFLKKSPGKYIDLNIEEDKSGCNKIIFKLENYKNPVSIDLEKIFEGIFWTEFFDADKYTEVSEYVDKFEKLNT
ncbi:MAG: hypothetical protein US56_C0042G0001, partial [Candidatus Moranbacteria bacterium GW2011_GWF2_37_7]